MLLMTFCPQAVMSLLAAQGKPTRSCTVHIVHARLGVHVTLTSCTAMLFMSRRFSGTGTAGSTGSHSFWFSPLAQWEWIWWGGIVGFCFCFLALSIHFDSSYPFVFVLSKKQHVNFCGAFKIKIYPAFSSKIAFWREVMAPKRVGLIVLRKIRFWGRWVTWGLRNGFLTSRWASGRMWNEKQWTQC